MCGKVGCNFGEILSVFKGQKSIQRIIVVDEKSLLELTPEALSQLESIKRDLLLKRVEIQHQVSYICTHIHMIMMKNLLLWSVLELSMKNMKKYYRKKHNLRQILINVKHIMKLQEEKRGKKVYGLGSEDKNYYGSKFSVSS